MNGETLDTATMAEESAPKRRRRGALILLTVLALFAGVASSWVYNSGLPSRQRNDAAIVRAAVDPSTYAVPGDYYRVTVPIRNDSPFAVTVVGLYLPSAPRILWDGAWTVIRSGGTAALHVSAPFNCPAVQHKLKHTSAVPVLLRVRTVNGRSHPSLRTTVSGVLQYAADYCAAAPKKKRPPEVQ